MKTKAKDSTRDIPVTSIIANPSDNPRFCSEAGSETAEAYAQKFYKSREFTTLCGALNATNGPTVPIVVEDRGDGKYNLLDGWGRHEWARRKSSGANRKNPVMLPAIVKPQLTDSARMTLRVALNTARNAYDPLAEGAAYASLIEHCGGVNAVAKRVGRPITVVNERVRLYRLPKHVLNLYRSGHLLLSAAEVFFKIDGNVDYTKRQGGETLDPEGNKRADEYERIVGIMVTEITNRIHKAAQSNGRRTFTRGSVRSIYNTAIGKASLRRGGNYLRISADRIERHTPEQAKLDSFMMVYGDKIVREILSDKMSEGVVESLSESIVTLGVGRGLSCPLDLVPYNTDEDNQPVYPVEVAQALNRALVRRVVAAAYLCRTRRVVPHGHELTATQAAWENFLRNPKNLTSMLAAIEQVTVPDPAVT